MKGRMYLIAGLLLTALHAEAQETGDALQATCAACHGVAGEGNSALGAPRLAGQQYEYLLQQLQSFKAGTRGYHAQDHQGVLMRSALSGVPNTALAPLARHYAELPKGNVPALPSAGKGAEVYQGTCAFCHGPDARGNAHLQAPDLRLLDAEYLDRQLRSYANGLRGDSGDAGVHAPWMRSIAWQLGDADRRAVVEYLSGIQAAED